MASKKKPADYYRFDDSTGAFVNEREISANWLLSQVLGRKGLRITMVSNEDITAFLTILRESELRMMDGQHSLFWLRKRMKDRLDMSTAQDGESHYRASERYRYIIEQIDMILVGSDVKEHGDPEPGNKINRTPNNMEIRFEPE